MEKLLFLNRCLVNDLRIYDVYIYIYNEMDWGYR